ncbi:hypothetical protein EUX98_g1332 [Antrodiella citrinella]|uniref:Nucleoporin Nup54 alpha-helical domain-containing protein n=1 Tax=Antrodiella citrinella TaxID=2447956 RepID=A0A4S4N3A0_9APHY|nr:hypothetical protein EUX98_g1332 [Antrodiella citrinella]
MFSTASTSQQPNPQQGSIFGAPLGSAPSQQGTGNLFGGQQQQQQQQNAAQPNAGGGLFGNLGQTNQAGQGGNSGGGGLFGNAPAAPATGGGIFGNANNGTAGSGLFANTNTNQQPAAGGGLFGNMNTNTNATGATAGGLFGNTGAAPAANTGGGLFGTNNMANSAPGTGGGLFGNNPIPANNTGSGLFANTNTGAAGTTGGLFANTNTNPAAGGGLFGNTNTAGTSNTGGGLFGNANTGTAGTGTTGGGLFGNTNTAAGTSGGGLFGNAGTAGQSTTGGGLFGNTNTGNTGGGIFGNMNNAQPANNPFGNLNTQQQQQQQTAPQGGLFTGFGQNNQQKSGGFGQTQTQPQQGSLFGGPTSGNLFGGSTLGSSTLGVSTLGGLRPLNGSTNNLLASRANAMSQQQQDPQSQYAALMQRIEAIAQAWNSSSPNCQFQHYFYNLVDPAQVHLYGRPQNAVNDALWQKAVRENPDPSCFVPVIASGFDDIQQRVEAQSRQAQAHQNSLKELKTRIRALTEKHEVTNSARLMRAATLQTQLTQRVMRVVQHLHLLIPALRSSSIRAEEETLRARLEEIAEEIKRPGGLGRLKGKLNELWAFIGALNAAKDRDRKDSGRGWAVVDEDGLTQIAQILANEQAGLAHVMKVLQRDLKDLNVIEGKPNKEDDPDALLMSSLRYY